MFYILQTIIITQVAASAQLGYAAAPGAYVSFHLGNQETLAIFTLGTSMSKTTKIVFDHDQNSIGILTCGKSLAKGYY